MPRRRPKLGRLYPRFPEPIFCWLCGDSLEGATWAREEPPYFVYAKQEWKDAWDEYRRVRSLRERKFSLEVPVSDLDFGFSRATEWILFYRVIIPSDLPHNYQLTGIGYMPGGRSLEANLFAPRDPKTACLGAGKANSQTLRVYPVPHPFSKNYYGFFNDNPRSGIPGYVLHSRCWDLVERIIGPTQAMLHLDKIVAALRDQWNDILANDAYKGDHGRPPGWFEFMFYHELDDYYNRMDPLFIPEVERLLRDSSKLLEARKQMEAHGNGKDSCNNIFQHKVPLEIKYLISEHLCLMDARNMLIALGENFPTNVWKRRVPIELLFEFKNDVEEGNSSSSNNSNNSNNRNDSNDSNNRNSNNNNDSNNSNNSNDSNSSNFNGDKTFAWDYLAAQIERRDILGSALGVKSRRRILNMLTPISQNVIKAINQQNAGSPASH
ncbi:hypothetical protein FQN50_008142 [Emmonsiellopsis sp. PD_5]|nr:hypothetical protein FQN50_008142 [Emmonsiellopsis sp. PD_5]